MVHKGLPITDKSRLNQSNESMKLLVCKSNKDVGRRRRGVRKQKTENALPPHQLMKILELTIVLDQSSGQSDDWAFALVP